MLLCLSIKDFAIIDELEVEFGPGLNAMTGETGAGKTIIVEALRLVLGARAATDIIRSGKDRASVTAVFDTTHVPRSILSSMEAAGIACDGEIIVHRVIGQQGRGKISINGVPTTAAMLKEVAAHLVDISSQHEHQLLLDEARHAVMLDDFAGLSPMRSDYVEAYASYAKAHREFLDLEEGECRAREKLDFLRFQLTELTSANVMEGELESLEAERSRIKHAVVLGERTSGAEVLLSGEDASVLALLRCARQSLEQCAPYEPRAAVWCEALERARRELDDISRDLASYADGLDSDPARLEEIDDRIHLIKGLARKHGGSADALIARRKQLAEEVGMVENYEGLLKEKRCLMEEFAVRRRATAAALHEARERAARNMGQGVAGQLCDLGMGKTEFAVLVELAEEETWNESGPDVVRFMISPNMGEPLRPLARIASGGELSRVMLALKGALAGSGEVASTSVFDEVDSGIGGGIATVVGRKLRDLAGCRQVICITHLPQVAAFASCHLRISKDIKGSRTVTSLAALDENARVSEIARMLAGEKVTDAAVKHAEEMIREASC
jgi:DNA repair protein RecN (Recombination protein N)